MATVRHLPLPNRQVTPYWYPIDRTLLSAAYILRCAEEYVDCCDGPIDLIALRSGPSIQFVGAEVVKKIDEDIKKNQIKVFSELLSISSPFPTWP